MYDELVKRLRNCTDLHGECALCQFAGNPCDEMPETPLNEAADAIEDLTRQNEALEHAVKREESTGIYIKGIEMPTKGNPITVLIYPDGMAEWSARNKIGRATRVPAQWISVEERLPDDGQWVLVWGHGQKVPTMMFRRSGAWIYDQFEFCTTVTHWKPLPEPPKED